jgi:hypothetical protein
VPQSLRRQLARVKAMKIETPTIGEAGLAFLLAYVGAYFFSAL